MKTKIISSVDPIKLYISTKPDSAMAVRDTLILLTLRAADFKDSDRREKLEVIDVRRLGSKKNNPDLHSD